MTKKYFYTVLLLVSMLLTATAQDETKEDKPSLQLGGALVFHYNHSSWNKNQTARLGDFGIDRFQINGIGEYKGISLDVDYRFYPKEYGGGILKHGWFQYKFNKKFRVQVGISQVPFGIQTYASYNWFFTLGYYIGLEEDYDMGVKYIYETGKFQIQAAFYKNAENDLGRDSSPISTSRYSFDVAGRNQEVNQGNLKLAYSFGKKAQSKFSLSGMSGQLYNVETEKTGTHSAFAISYELNVKNFGAKLQHSSYNKKPNDTPGFTDFVEIGAYNGMYEVAAKGTLTSICLAYTFPIKKLGPISSIQVYNDYSWLKKAKEGYADSKMNTFGFLVVAGKVLAFVDFAMGQNHPFLGPVFTNALSTGVADAAWYTRFNINIGYYF